MVVKRPGAGWKPNIAKRSAAGLKPATAAEVLSSIDVEAVVKGIFSGGSRQLQMLIGLFCAGRP